MTRFRDTSDEISKDTDVWRAVSTLGNRFDHSVLNETRSLFAPLVASKKGQNVIRDLSYGPAMRNRIDIYPSATDDSPVLLFVHGGGFTAGDKNVTRDFYGNVGSYFCEQGFTVALMNYRLAPDDPWPAASDDIAAATLWLRENVAEFGGAPGKIVAFGHSAGATHVAGFLLGASYKPIASCLSGAVLLSGVYFIEAPLSDGRAAYFGVNPVAYPERSSANGHVPNNVPVWIGYAELDPPEFAEQATRLFESVAGRSRSAVLLKTCQFHNHVSTIFSLGTSCDTVGRQISEFVHNIF